jgi:hypothetical protein
MTETIDKLTTDQFDIHLRGIVLVDQDKFARLEDRVRALEQMLTESGKRPLVAFTETELFNLCSG